MNQITGNEPATGFAIPGDEKSGWLPETVTGLTIRQHYAGLAIQGILANHTYDKWDDYADMARDAINAADALIAALNFKAKLEEALNQ